MTVKEYMIGMFSVAVLFSVLSLLPLNDAAQTLRKRAFSLLMFASAVLPLSSLLAEGIVLSDVGESAVSYEDGSALCIEEGLCEGIRLAVSDAFSLPKEDVRVRVSGLDTSTMQAQKVSVFLTGTAALADSRAIAAYIEKEGWGRADVTVEIG